MADLAAYWYAENEDMWEFQQIHGSEIDEETGEPISQIIYASFWLDEDVAARDTAAWLSIADQLERKLEG